MTQTNQNKDYSWQWLDEALIAYLSRHTQLPNFDPTENRDLTKAFIQAKFEQEVEQRCIEAQLKLVEGAYIDQDVIYFRFPGGFADEYTMRQRLREQLSTNNKDTLERSSDDR